MITAQQFAAALRAAASALEGTSGTAPSVVPADVATVAATAPPPMTNVTADQLTALIMPHISNETVKAALGEAMRANGVSNLPETPSHLYPTLYKAFQDVLARFGLGTSTLVAAAPASII